MEQLINMKDDYDKKIAIGIDLGTTFSCIGLWTDGKVQILQNETGSCVTPSMVSFSGHERLIGMGAKNQAVKNPKNTIFDAKRLIGRKVTDKEVESDIELFPFKVKGDHEGRPQIEVEFMDEKKLFYPEQISAMILGQLKKNAEKFT